MKIISNAIVYKLDLPSDEAMLGHLEKMAFEPITPQVYGSHGFIPVKRTNELLCTMNGGFMVTLRCDDKILPPASVRAAVAKAVEQAELAAEEEGKEFSAEFKDVVEAEVRKKLVESALVKTSTISAIYSRKSGILAVLTSSVAKADLLVNRLIAAVGSVKSTTIHVNALKGGLTTRLKEYLRGNEDAFGGFNLGDSCVMRGTAGRASFDLDNIATVRNGLRDVLERGMEVDRLELEHNGAMSFRLTHNFHLCGIHYFGKLTEEEIASRKDMDIATAFRMEAATQLLELDAAIAALCELFGYKEERDSEEAKDRKAKGDGDQDDNQNDDDQNDDDDGGEADDDAN